MQNAATSTEMTSSIPIIDISTFIQKSNDKTSIDNILMQWNDAFRKLGFAVITGHGVDENIIEAIYSKANKFFSLPKEEKLKYDKKMGYGNGGYTPMGAEAVGKSKGNDDALPDYVESFVIQDNKFDEIPNFLRQEVIKYNSAMKILLQQIMSLSASALNLPQNYFKPYFNYPECSLRLGFYPKQNIPPIEGQLRYSAHTDYTGFTFLRPDAKGLQVKHPSGSWIDVPLIKNSIIVNSGDLIELWTNGIWKSNLHRVINPSTEESQKSRLSIVCFTGPNGSSLITPIDNCVKERDGKVFYNPVLASEHLQMKLQKTTV